MGLSNSKEINLYRYGSGILSNRSGNRHRFKDNEATFKRARCIFTLGECLSSNDALPNLGYKWNTTKYPIVLDQWRDDSSDRKWIYNHNELDKL